MYKVKFSELNLAQYFQNLCWREGRISLD